MRVDLSRHLIHKLNPFYGKYVHSALCVNCLRQKNYANAYPETLKLNRPALFWDHLSRASTLGLLGNIKDGRKSAAELLKLKPNFTERGRMLIRHYIKFEDIVERVIKGLDITPFIHKFETQNRIKRNIKSHRKVKVSNSTASHFDM